MRGSITTHTKLNGTTGKPSTKTSGVSLHVQMEKMSKSRFNVINSDDVIDQYGADAIRLYLLFIGPVTASTPWQDAGVEGGLPIPPTRLETRY